MATPKLGFIGIGVMGLPMAAHLAAAGYRLTIYDVDRARMERAVCGQPAIMTADTPLEVAKVSEVVFTMLPSGRHVQEAVLGKHGLIEGFNPGSLLVDTSSSEVWLTKETAARLKAINVDMIDAAVSGAESGAIAGELVFMAGGESSAVSRAEPMLNVMGNKIFHLGPLGAGHTMKCLNNTITAMTYMATAEALTIGKRQGLDPDVMTDVLNVSTGMSWISQTQIKQRITSRKFDDAFKLELMVKDIGIAMHLADEAALPAPLSALGHHLWKTAGKQAGGGASISEMVRWVESMTKTEITSKE